MESPITMLSRTLDSLLPSIGSGKDRVPSYEEFMTLFKGDSKMARLSRKTVGAMPETRESVHRVMAHMNGVMHGYGVGVYRGDYVDSYWQNTNYLYVNLGDITKKTFVYDVKEDRYLVAAYSELSKI